MRTELAEKLGITFDTEDCDTFGGYIFGILGEIPDDGTTLDLETDDLIIKVESVLDHRIETTLVTVKERVVDEDDEDLDDEDEEKEEKKSRKDKEKEAEKEAEKESEEEAESETAEALEK